jgi:hypothetical protein
VTHEDEARTRMKLADDTHKIGEVEA